MRKMKKMMVAMMASAAAIGAGVQADAASGYVNLEAVLASNPAFVQAGRTVASEQQRLQREFEQKSRNMSDKDKQALAERLNRQLAEKENQVMRPIQTKLRAAIEKAAKDKKVDIVINAANVVYGGIDLTSDVQANMR